MPLLGRQAELTEIAHALDALDGGHGGFLLVCGAPGIGKSALLAALEDDAAARDHRVLAGRATELEHGMPFGVLVDALDAHLAELGEERLARTGLRQVAELATVFPALEALSGVGTNPAPERYSVHRALGGLLAALASARPLVLVLDDLQWADEASLEALAALARRPPAGRVLIAGAHRPDPALDDLAHQLDRQGGTRLRLGPLADADAAQLVEGRVPAAVRHAVLAEAAGNPFYLEQLARSPASAPRGAAAGGDRLPPAIAVSIRQEVERLSPAAQRLLQGAAVAGEPADLRMASVAADLELDAALEALDELQAAELLHAAGSGTAFAFRHPLVRRAVYEDAGLGWRIAAHGRVRHVLAGLGADATVLAHHVARGAVLGDDEGIALLVAAAERVADRAPGDAAAWLAAALRLLPEDQSGRRAALLERRGVALLAAGELAAAREALLEAGLDTAEKHYRLAEVERWLGLEQEAVRRLARARDLAGDAQPRVRVKVEMERMLIHEWNLRYDEARTVTLEAIAAAEASGDPLALAEVQGVMATTLVQTEPRAAVTPYEACAAALAAYDDHDFPAHPMCLWDLGWAATYLERFDEACAHFDRGLRIARARHAHGNVAMFLADRAEPRYRAGRLAEAIEQAEEAVEAARVTPSPRYLWWALVRLALVLGRAGDGPQATEAAAECERVAAQLPASPLLRLWTAHAAAAAAAALGDDAEAARVLAAAAGGPELELVAPIDRNRPLLMVVRAALAEGRVEDADRWARAAETWGAESGLGAQLGFALSARALGAEALSDAAGAADLAARAATAQDAAGCRLEALRARVLQGRLAAAAARRDEAVTLLEDAEVRLHALSAAADHAAVVRELRRLGRRPPPRATAPAGHGAADGDERLATLSPREREVAELVAAGATNGDVAAALFLSKKTVETHLRNIFAKVGVGNREALSAAMRRARREDPVSSI